MDDLTMLRDLGRDLEHEPPATLVRQRRRLLDAATGVRRRRRMPGWVALGLAAALTAVVLAVPSLLLRMNAENVMTDVGSSPTPRPVRALTILLLGTDDRTAGSRGDRGGAPAGSGPVSDAVVLLHLPADRKDVTVVSLPRDLLVRIPDCRASRGTTVKAHAGVIGSAFMAGGMPCLAKTVEESADVRVDHTVEIPYSGFKKLVDALGGVEVTLPKAVNDPKSGLRLPAGRSLVNGEQALAYARTRYALDDGSDLGRIERQQHLMGALLKKADTLLTEPERMFAFLKTVTESVTTDAGLDVATMLAIADGIRRAGVPAVHTVTVPVRRSASDPHRLELNRPASDRLFARLRAE
ncbi:LCP family protein [Sphaerisporangium sp. NPDC051017]|uniref:LCP family protein n=1 Tax=Sphaerisporangium sp. NPDC051017 TaxID=3154636 RepID=UPI0034143BDC